MSTIRRRQRKKGIVYEVVVDLGPDPRTGKRQQKTHSFPTLREAKIGQAKWLTEINSGTAIERSTQTVADVLTTWLTTEAAHRVKPSTLQLYTYILRDHLIPGVGSLQVQKMTPLQVQQYYTRMLEEGHSPWVVSNCHQRLRQALSMAVRLGLTQRNVTDVVTPPPTTARKMQTWTPEEVHTFLEAARPNRLWPLWELALTTGMRKGELLGLRWGDIDFTERSLRVQQAIYRTWVGSPKTKSGIRVVPLLPAPLESLREHRRHQNERRLSVGAAWQNNDFVFCTGDGGSYFHTNINLEHGKLIAQSGLPRIRFHDLRHTYATLALAAGIPSHVVSAILGHANISITLNTYAHVLPMQHQEVRERLDALIYGAM